MNAVYDLHVWSVTSGMVALSGHVQVPDPADNGRVLRHLRARFHDQSEIDHVTIQVEVEDCGEQAIHP